MSEMAKNGQRAQLLADQAFDVLMWNENGDGISFQERPVTERDRARVEGMTRLSQVYANLVEAEAAVVSVNMNGQMMNMASAIMATGQTTGQTAGAAQSEDPVAQVTTGS